MEHVQRGKDFETLRNRIVHTINEFRLQVGGCISVSVSKPTHIHIKVTVNTPGEGFVDMKRLGNLYSLACLINGIFTVYTYTSNIKHEVYDIIDCAREYPYMSPASLFEDVLKPLKRTYENTENVWIDIEEE